MGRFGFILKVVVSKQEPGGLVHLGGSDDLPYGVLGHAPGDEGGADLVDEGVAGALVLGAELVKGVDLTQEGKELLGKNGKERGGEEAVLGALVADL